MFSKVILIGLGGFIGANLRYFISGWVLDKIGTRLPYGTLFVNGLGSLVLGFILVYATEVSTLSPGARLFIATGLLGALTTFSTFSYETFELIQSANYCLAVWNIGLNLIVGLITVWIGSLAARAL